MTDRFILKEDGIHDKETDRIFKLDNNLNNLLNTLDKMLKQQLVRTHCQDQEIQKWIQKCDFLERYIESKGLAEECIQILTGAMES